MASAVLLLAWPVAGERGAAPSDANANRPQNVLLIVVDTLRRDHLGVYGYRRNTSPYIDAFFRQASIFPNATSPSPCTVPAVLQVLTGSRDFDEKRPRLSEVLRARGYATAAFVSQHHFGNRAKPKAAYRRGFDVFDIQSEKQVDLHSMTTRTAQQVTDPALAWLEARPKNAPFFLWLHYFDPHDPYEPPGAFRRFPTPAPGMDGDRRTRLIRAMDQAMAAADEERRARILAKPNPHAHFGARFSKDEVRTLRSLYDAEILYTDSQIQRVFEFLARTRVLDDTLVILTADHGERLGENDRWAHCQSLHGYEINVPLLVRHPRRGSQDRIPRAVSTLDIFPTVLRSLGIDSTPLLLDGVDLFEPRRNRFVRSVWSRERAVQNDRWKLVVTALQANREVSRLFDLVADPDETENVASAHAEVWKTLHQSMAAQTQRDAELLPRIDDTLEQLRAIGYVQ